MRWAAGSLLVLAACAGCGSPHAAQPDAVIAPDADGGSRYFLAPVRYPAVPGALATAVAVGDIDGNGTPDLVVAGGSNNGSHGEVGVLLNLGDGGFAPTSEVPAGTSPSSVTAVDLDGDGRDEVAVTMFAGGTGLWVSAAHADGLLGAFTDYPAGVWPEAVTAADVDGDGHPDLVAVSNLGSGESVTVLRGDGHGGFAAPWSSNAGPYPMDVRVADLDGDGIPDLAVADQGPVSGDSTAAVMHGHGDGTFDAPALFEVGNFPASIAVGDLNGDGRPDLAVANQYYGTMSVLLATGPGTFAPQQQYPEKGTGIAIADLDGDGRPEILIAGTGQGIALLHNAGDGTFDSTDFVGGGSRLVVADVNGDGRPDMVSVSVRLEGGIWSGTSDQVNVFLHKP